MLMFVFLAGSSPEWYQLLVQLISLVIGNFDLALDNVLQKGNKFISPFEEVQFI